MTKLEELKELIKTQLYNGSKGYEHTICDRDVNLIIDVINEFEELKRDVKGYFEISGHTHGNNELIYEWYELHSKLLKVGKEE